MNQDARFIATGELTRLRAFTRADVDCWLTWPRHADSLYSSFDPSPMSPAMRDAWFQDVVHRQGQLPFAIETLSGEMVGRLFLRHIKTSEGSAVLGIDLDPRTLGRGHGTDALRAFLSHFFSSGVFQQMLLTVAAYNERARCCYERLGFRMLSRHWARFRSRADVLREPRYAPIRHLFRPAPRGLEALMYDMVLGRAQFLSRRPSPTGWCASTSRAGDRFTYTPRSQKSQKSAQSHLTPEALTSSADSRLD